MQTVRAVSLGNMIIYWKGGGVGGIFIAGFEEEEMWGFEDINNILLIDLLSWFFSLHFHLHEEKEVGSTWSAWSTRTQEER